MFSWYVCFVVPSILDAILFCTPFSSQVLEIGENLKVLMSDERMAVLTKEIDDWAAKKAEEDSVEVGTAVQQ